MRKRDQWVIHNISTGESKSFDIKTPKRSPRFYIEHIKRSYKRPGFYFLFFRTLKKFKIFFAFRKNTLKKSQWFSTVRTKRTHVEIPQLRWLFSNTIKGGLSVLISVLVIYGVVHAGTITPPSGTPAAQFYSLSEIYNFITANTTATEGSPALDWSATLEGTGRTLTEIYDALASLISADKVKSGTTYLNVAGTLVPSGGTATTSNVLSGKTYLGDSQTDWTLQTGIMANNGAFALTASSSDQSVTAGYYSGGTLAGDVDLSAAKIANGIDIFSVIGTLLGDTDASKVLTTATYAGTYNAANLFASTTKSGISFGVGLTGNYPSATYPLPDDTAAGDAAAGNILSGLEAWTKAGSLLTGAMANNGAFALTASSSDQSVTAGYYSGGTLAGDADLVAGNISNGVNIFGVIGNLIAGYLYGDSDASKVLTSATGNDGANSYLATNLNNNTVKKGISYGVGPTTGAYSGYPGTGWSGTAITQAACDAQNPTWYWFEDGNGDGDTTDPEDGVCVRATTVTSLSWNGSEQMAATAITAQAATAGTANSITKDSAGWTANAYSDMVVDITSGTASGCWGIAKSNTTDTITVYGSWLSSAYASSCGTPDATSVFSVEDDGFALYDNSWIGDWTCTGSFPSGAPSWGSYPTSAKAGSGNIALAIADCYDGTRDLLPTEASRAVKTGTATAADATTITDTAQSLNTNAWVGQKVLITGGTGSGGYGRIESNTGTVITVDSWTGGTPGVGSTFAIVYLIPHASYNPTTDVDGDDDTQLNGNNGPLTQEVLNNWKGTRLPTASDFFGFCGYNSTDGSGDGSYENTTGTYTADKTFGNYGGQVGRTDEFLDLGNSGSWEWLSEQHINHSARLAGTNACSYFYYTVVYVGYRFRAVFRP